MPRKPDDRVDQARSMYLQGMKLVEIASQLSLPEGTVRRWKCTYKWDAPDNERSLKNNERSDKKRRNMAVARTQIVTTMQRDLLETKMQRSTDSFPNGCQKKQLQSSVRCRMIRWSCFGTIFNYSLLPLSEHKN